MKKHESIINEKVLNIFSEVRGRTLMNHVANSYDIEAAIAFASLYCPDVIEVDDCIFIAEFYNNNINSLRKEYKNKKDIEMFVNSWSLSSLLTDNDKINYKLGYIDEFARAIQYFWQLRMKKLFPDRDIIVEVVDGIMGEVGLAVTVYQS